MQVKIFAVNQIHHPRASMIKTDDIQESHNLAVAAKKGLEDEGGITNIRVWVETDDNQFMFEV